MYILIISQGYPSERYKMNGIFEFDQAKALVQAGYKVIYGVIDIRSFRRTRKWGFESLIKDGVQIEAINIPCGRFPKSILNSIRILGLRKLYNKIEEQYGKPDIIHAHFIYCGYTTACLFEGRKIPLVLTEHLSSMNQKVLSPYLLKLGNYTYPKINKVITVSSCLSNNIKEKFDVETTTIPNIVDTTSFKYKGETEKNNSFSFVSVGHLIERKGMDLLIEAFSRVFKENNNVELFIYGEGPERSKLEKMIQQYRLTDQVFLMGLVDRKKVADKMSRSDCFVLPSRLETFGVVYIEAMAMGLPVIATICGGPEDFVTEENGLLIPINDIDALVKAMKTIYQNNGFYHRKKISNITKETFGPQAVVNKLQEVYESL